MIVPVYPFRCHADNVTNITEGMVLVDCLLLVECVDGLGQCVIVGVAFPADGLRDPGLGEALCVANRGVLHTAVTVMH